MKEGRGSVGRGRRGKSLTVGVTVGRVVVVTTLAWKRHQLEEEYGMGGQDVDVGG